MLEVRLDGFVLLVEVGQVGHYVLYDVGVREWVDLGLFLGICGDSACILLARLDSQVCSSDRTMPMLRWSIREMQKMNIHKQASVLTPSIFIAQLPQIPSLQLRRNVRVGSISFLMRISASSTIGPVLLRSSVYVCMCGFVEGSSGFQR